MKKAEIIASILECAYIHRNIYIDFSKMPDWTEEDDYDWSHDAQFCIDTFIEYIEEMPMNDCGNRNMCGCNKVVCTKDNFKQDNKYNGRHYINDSFGWKSYEEAKALGLIDKRTTEDPSLFLNGACRKHDLWHFYTRGRNSSTLYWDKYWNDDLVFTHAEYELEEMLVPELREILKEIKLFNKLVAEMMIKFYEQCEYSLKDLREEKATEEKSEELYQKTLETVTENHFIKRLVAELL